MGAGQRTRMPTLSVGSIGTVTACPRRLSRHLDPEDRPQSRVNDGRFRLGKAISEAIRAAHEVADLCGDAVGDVLDDTAPPELGREEARRFRTALEHYAEFAEGRPVRLHPQAGATLTRPSRDGTWSLRADLGLLFSTPDDDIELRRVTSGPAPLPRHAGPSDGDLARIALLGPAVLGRKVLVVQLFTEGVAHVVLHEVTEPMVREVRDRLVESVDHARAHSDQAVTGWWCTSCPCIAGCPAVPSTRIGELLP